MIDSHRNTPLNSLEGLRVAKATFLAGGRRFPGIYWRQFKTLKETFGLSSEH